MVPHSDKARSEDRRNGERRRVSRYRFLDRRTAFDRRRRYPVLGPLRDSSWLLLAVLIAANLLSLADGVLTALEIQAGIATEGNPILAPLYASSPYFAIAFKIVVVALVSVGIWHQRRYRHVLAVSLLALVIFTSLLAYHLGNLQGLGYL